MKYNLYFYKLILTIFKLIKLENLFRNNNFKCVISHTHVYASLSSLSIRLAIKNKIKVLMPIGKIIVYKKSADYLKSELSITKDELKKFVKKENSGKGIRNLSRNQSLVNKGNNSLMHIIKQKISSKII